MGELGAAPTPKGPRRLKKREALIEVLQANPNGQFLIFSHYELPFFELEDDLNNLLIRTAHLTGPAQNKDGIAKRLADFECGRLRVLLISNRTAVL